MHSQKKAVFLALSAVFLWSTVAVSFKIALQYVNFIQLLFFSSFTAIICFLLISIGLRKLKSLLKVTYKNLVFSAIVGFLNPFLYYTVLFKAYSVLPAQIAQPLNYLWPAVLVILSAPLLGQKLNVLSIVSVFVGFIGVYVISTRGAVLSFDIKNPLGVILAVGSSVIWALSWILNQKDKRDAQTKLFWAFVFGFIYTSIVVLIKNDFIIPETNGIFAVIYVGLFEMGITFFLWLRALQITDRNDSLSNLVFLSPFAALIFIHYILGEQLFYTTFIGLFLIIVGIFIQKIKPLKKSIGKKIINIRN